MGNLKVTQQFLLVALLVFSIQFFPLEMANAQTTILWTTQTVDSRGAGGVILIDAQNNLRIFYHQETIDDINYQPQGLFYAVLVNQKWNVQHLNDTAGNILIMGKNNKPHIVSIDSDILTDIPLNSNWDFNQLGVERIADRTMKLDSAGNLHVLTGEQKYFPENESYGRYLYYHNWTRFGDSKTLLAQTTTTGAYFDYLYPICIAVDLQNNPQIIFQEQTEVGKRNTDGYSFYTASSNIIYAKYSDSKLSFQTIAENVSTSPIDIGDLLLDSKGLPHLCYIGEKITNVTDSSYIAQNFVGYTYFDGQKWINQIVDSEEFNHYSHPNLQLDKNGNPQVYYYIENYRTEEKTGLMLAKWTGDDWESRNLGSVPFNSNREFHDQTRISDIAFDFFGNPYVLYSDIVGTYRSAARYGDLTLAFLNITSNTQSLILSIAPGIIVLLTILLALLLLRRHRVKINPQATSP